MQRVNLKGKTLFELQTFVESLGEKKYRATQLFSWLYAKGVDSFDEMSDISKELREILEKKGNLKTLTLVAEKKSEKDGTTKFLFGLNDGLVIESVLIPPEPTSPDRERRLTLCVSTQVGCPLDCKFCATGAMGFTRNLSTGEIIDQVIQAQKHSTQRISNLVFMGMGEPMLNYENVMKSVEILTDDRSINIGTRHITISTAGYADKIRQMADEKRKVKLALSLHSLDNQKRVQLMPITKKHNVEGLLNALTYYYQKTRQRPTIEYILFEHFNDGTSDIKRLVEMSRRLPCKINLIPFHSIDFMKPAGVAATLRPVSRTRMEEFAQALRAAKITVMIRSSSGEDIMAACGQLAALESRQTHITADTQSSLAFSH